MESTTTTTTTTTSPRLGDVVLIDDCVGVIRYIGPLQKDKSTHFGIEIKGQPLSQGHDGTLDNIKYFHAPNGHGIFIKQIHRIISSEELLEKVASLYEIIKYGNSHSSYQNSTIDTINSKDKNSRHANKESNITARYFVDKSRYEELLHELESLQTTYEKILEKCENLELQNQMLRGQSVNKIEDIAKLHDKVNSWANRFGMRRPTLSSLDDSTINEINSLIQTKENHKTHRSYMSNSHLPTSSEILSGNTKQLIGDYEAPVLLNRSDIDTAEARNSHSKTRGDQRRKDRGSRVMDENELPRPSEEKTNGSHQKTSRVARESMEVSSSTVQTQILNPTMSQNINENKDNSEFERGHAKPKARESIQIEDIQHVTASSSTRTSRESKVMDKFDSRDIGHMSDPQSSYAHGEEPSNPQGNKSSDFLNNRNTKRERNIGVDSSPTQEKRHGLNGVDDNVITLEAKGYHEKETYDVNANHNIFVHGSEMNSQAHRGSVRLDKNINDVRQLNRPGNSMMHDRNQSSIEISNMGDIFDQSINLATHDSELGMLPNNLNDGGAKRAREDSFSAFITDPRQKAEYDAATTNSGKRRGSVGNEESQSQAEAHRRSSTINSILSENNYFNQVD